MSKTFILSLLLTLLTGYLLSPTEHAYASSPEVEAGFQNFLKARAGDRARAAYIKEIAETVARDAKSKGIPSKTLKDYGITTIDDLPKAGKAIRSLSPAGLAINVGLIALQYALANDNGLLDTKIPGLQIGIDPTLKPDPLEYDPTPPPPPPNGLWNNFGRAEYIYSTAEIAAQQGCKLYSSAHTVRTLTINPDQTSGTVECNAADGRQSGGFDVRRLKTCPTNYTYNAGPPPFCVAKGPVEPTPKRDQHCDITRTSPTTFALNTADPDCAITSLPSNVTVTPSTVTVGNPGNSTTTTLNPDGSTTITERFANPDGTTTVTTTNATPPQFSGDSGLAGGVQITNQTTNITTTTTTVTNTDGSTTTTGQVPDIKFPDDYNREVTQKEIQKTLDDSLKPDPANTVDRIKQDIDADRSLEDAIESVSSTIDLSTAIDHSRDLSATCPANRSYNVLSAVIPLNYGPFCELAAKMSFLILISASLISIRIISTAL